MKTYRPDVLARGLTAVFCGINPAASAELAGYNFSTPSNRFWAVLHLSGFTDMRLRPQDERRLLEYGYGITAAVRRSTKRASEVSLEEFRHARSEFETRMRRYAPHAIAFLGKRAFSAMMNQTDVPWGRQSLEFAGAIAWVLPNPSGLNRNFTLAALVGAYSEFRTALRR
jgi:TDG/mug DNA glycosylase family protein